MNGFRLADLLSFEKLLSLTLLRLVYFAGLLGITIGVLVSAFGAFGVMSYSFKAGLGTLLAALFFGALGVLIWRAICELWTVIFGIYDRLGQIRDHSSAPKS